VTALVAERLAGDVTMALRFVADVSLVTSGRLISAAVLVFGDGGGRLNDWLNGGASGLGAWCAGLAGACCHFTRTVRIWTWQPGDEQAGYTPL